MVFEVVYFQDHFFLVPIFMFLQMFVPVSMQKKKNMPSKCVLIISVGLSEINFGEQTWWKNRTDATPAWISHMPGTRQTFHEPTRDNWASQNPTENWEWAGTSKTTSMHRIDLTYSSSLHPSYALVHHMPVGKHFLTFSLTSSEATAGRESLPLFCTMKKAIPKSSDSFP